MSSFLTVAALLNFMVIVVGQPQNSEIFFPEELDTSNEGGNRQQFPSQQSNNQGLTSQGDNFQGFPSFQQPNRFPSRQTRPTQRPMQRPPSRQTTTAATDDGTTTTTRIPPRDPTNRIVFIVPNCNCPFTYQYNPVCGTDGQTYGNMGVIQCAMSCGSRVQVYLVGACGRNNG